MMSKEQIIVQLNPDTMPSGSDLAVVNAARRSFGKRSDWDYTGIDPSVPHVKRLKEKDKRLIEFLARGMTVDDFEEFKEEIQRLGYNAFNQQGTEFEGVDLGLLLEELWEWRNTPTHDTPFNHCFVSFEVKAPLFVRSHLVKTEYTIMSEFSRRYITDDIEFYEHDYREVAKDKKQGSGGLHEDSDHWQKQARMKNLEQLDLYNQMIKSRIAPEQARGCLPQDLMTAWTWSGTLGAMAKMCRERLGSDAQKETSYVAEQVYEYLKEYYPVSAKCLVEGC